MLSFCNHHGKQGRREFLRVGGLALGGLTLPGLLSLQAQAAGSGTLLKNKSVIFLFMHGGPSQIETFDPKMTAPSGIHSVTGEVTTKIPGVTFGGTFPRYQANRAQGYAQRESGFALFAGRRRQSSRERDADERGALSAGH